MGTYFKALNDKDEAYHLSTPVPIPRGFICGALSSEILYSLLLRAGGRALYMADLFALLAVGCILIREGLRHTLRLVDLYGF